MLRVTPVYTQPTHRAFDNIFQVGNGEHFKTSYEYQGGCSSCGPRSTIQLTDARLIIREELNCIGRCCRTPEDLAVFLDDIDLMRVVSQRKLTIMELICGFITCTCCLDYLCGCCCGRPALLEIRGAFGSEVISFASASRAEAANTISNSILSAKSKLWISTSTDMLWLI